MLLSGAVYVIWIDTPYKDVATLREKAKVIEGYIADADSAQAKLDKITEKYKAFPQDGDHRLQVLLPEKIDTVRLVIDVNEIAMRHGMTISKPMASKAAKDETSAREYAPYSLSFTTTATYKVFREFLGDLERSLALREIVSLAFTSSESTPDSNGVVSPEYSTYSFGITIASYGLH